MRTWKLTPTDLADPIWKKWSPEPIIVRGESESEARHLTDTETDRGRRQRIIIKEAN